jgi:hypothetical protein
MSKLTGTSETVITTCLYVNGNPVTPYPLSKGVDRLSGYVFVVQYPEDKEIVVLAPIGNHNGQFEVHAIDLDTHQINYDTWDGATYRNYGEFVEGIAPWILYGAFKWSDIF